MITLDQLQAGMPLAKGRAGKYLDPLNAAMRERDISTGLRMASFLAQVATESLQLFYVAEIADGSRYDLRKDLGNTKPEAVRIATAHNSTPGRWWKGHGLIQVTGYDNHLACGNALDLDLLNAPELITEPVGACRSATWFWDSRGLNAWADQNDQREICLRVNGGYNGLAKRLAFFEGFREILC